MAKGSQAVRTRRKLADIRQQLLESALVEFAAHGFDGASTLAIANRAGAHQPQINYHFENKDQLWRAAVEHLFTELATELDIAAFSDVDAGPQVLAAAVGEAIHRFVRFAAARPELNRIMVHEATMRTERLVWMTERFVEPFAVRLREAWVALRAADIAAPIDPLLFHHVLVGAASLVFTNAPEFVLMNGHDPTESSWVRRHADGLIAMLLPGMVTA